MQQLISGTTRIFGIIGYPIRHSLSPVMQNEALRLAGLDAVYVPFEVEPQRLEEAVRGLRALGVDGFNVTIPHKTTIIPFLDQLDESALAAGAVNTVKRAGERLIGYNTDGDGLLRSLQQCFGFDPQGKNVVMVGAGGAARGACAAFCRAGVRTISCINRTVVTAELMLTSLAGRYADVTMKLVQDRQSIDDALATADLLVNSTSLGMNQEKIAGVALDKLPEHAIVYDMVYSPACTPLLQAAGLRGLRFANGLGMLACQGELGFLFWTDQEPGQGIMMQALNSRMHVDNA